MRENASLEGEVPLVVGEDPPECNRTLEGEVALDEKEVSVTWEVSHLGNISLV